MLLQLREYLAKNACIGYSIVVILVNILVVYCKVVHLSYHPTVCFKWINMAFNYTEWKFQLIIPHLPAIVSIVLLQC